MVDVVGLRYVEVGRQQVEAGAKSYQRTVDQTVRSIQVAASATQQQGRSLDRLTRDVQKAEREMQRLAQAQARGSITGAQFTGEVNRLSARLRSAGLENAQSQVMRYARASSEAARATAVHTGMLVTQNAVVQANAQAHQFASRAQNASGMAMQQVGYQVGDFLVQVQSGTNAFVAFGQQATQLVGILPMFGSVLGVSGTALIGLSAGLGIAIPLLTAVGAAFMRTRQSAEDAGDGIETLADRVGSARRALADLNTEVEMLRRGFEDAARFAFIQGIEDAERQIETLTAALEGLNERQIARRGLGDTAAELAAQQELLATLREQLEVYVQQRQEEARLSALQDRRAFAAETALELQNQIRLYETIAQFGEDSAEAEAERARQARETFQLEAMREGLYGQMLVDQMALYDAMVDARNAAEGTADAVAQINFTSAIAGAEALARSLGSSLATARLIAGMGGAGAGDEALDPRSPRFNPAAAEQARRDAELAAIRESFNTPAGGGGGGGGGGGAAARTAADYVDQLFREAEARERLIGLSEQEREREERRRQILSEIENLQGTVSEARINQLLQEEERVRALEEAEQRRQSLVQGLEGAFSNFFMTVFNDVNSLEEAFSNMLRAIANQLMQQLIVDPLSQSLAGAIGGLIPIPAAANGAAFGMGGSVTPFATGGVVSSPTLFTFANGGRLGLMGEAGPEAILPLSRGKDGKLGVQASGVGSMGANVVINNYTGEEVQTSERNGKLEVQIGRILARDIQNGGPTYQAIRRTFGLSQPATRRG